MRRIRLVLALAAVMVVSLVAAFPAYAVIARIAPSESLNMVDDATGTPGGPDGMAFEARRYAASLGQFKEVEEVDPGYGAKTVSLKR